MANDGETVREVCELIRIPRLDLFNTYDELANRILAAHEREMAAVVAERDAEILRRATLEREMAAKDAEIEMLNLELKQVSGRDLVFWDDFTTQSARPSA